MKKLTKEDLKQKVVQVKEWTTDHAEVLIPAAGFIGASVIGIAVCGKLDKKMKTDKRDQNLEEHVEEQVSYVIYDDDRFLYQLEDQDQNWMAIVAETKSGEPADLKEIGRQIAEGEFREE